MLGFKARFGNASRCRNFLQKLFFAYQLGAWKSSGGRNINERSTHDCVFCRIEEGKHYVGVTVTNYNENYSVFDDSDLTEIHLDWIQNPGGYLNINGNTIDEANFMGCLKSAIEKVNSGS